MSTPATGRCGLVIERVAAEARAADTGNGAAAGAVVAAALAGEEETRELIAEETAGRLPGHGAAVLLRELVLTALVADSALLGEPSGWWAGLADVTGTGDVGVAVSGLLEAIGARTPHTGAGNPLPPAEQGGGGPVACRSRRRSAGRALAGAGGFADAAVDELVWLELMRSSAEHVGVRPPRRRPCIGRPVVAPGWKSRPEMAGCQTRAVEGSQPVHRWRRIVTTDARRRRLAFWDRRSAAPSSHRGCTALDRGSGAGVAGRATPRAMRRVRPVCPPASVYERARPSATARRMPPVPGLVVRRIAAGGGVVQGLFGGRVMHRPSKGWRCSREAAAATHAPGSDCCSPPLHPLLSRPRPSGVTAAQTMLRAASCCASR